MKQARQPARAVDVKSPCINVCRMQGEFCLGCQRTLDEIARWSAAGDDERRLILERVARRREAAVRPN